MKKLFALLLALAMVLSLAACSVEKEEAPAETQAAAVEAPAEEAAPAAATEITLWTYPIGGWGNQETVDALMADFEAATGIKVTVEYLTYADGDDKVNTAIEGNAAPDLIMEGPERLVANWGAKGKMVNIADLYDDTDKAEINAAALAACFADEATAYEYPLVMTAHCMGINKTVFEAAGAMEHIDEATHTWKSVADFEAAIAKVYAHTGSTVGAVYCVGQGGDQGTRALVNNLKGGTFTNPEHTEYTWGSEENIAALKKLYDNPAIAFDSGGVASGPLTSSFILPFAIGVCLSISGEEAVLSSAFGVVALVAMIPPISIQLLGFRSIITTRVEKQKMMQKILSSDDEQIIDFM